MRPPGSINSAGFATSPRTVRTPSVKGEPVTLLPGPIRILGHRLTAQGVWL